MTRDADHRTLGDAGLHLCHACRKVAPRHETQDGCPRCGEPVYRRFPRSLQETWALWLTALIFFVPANTLPIMKVSAIGHNDASTIMDGVILFLHEGMYFIAFVIFFASVLVPLFKLVGMLILLLSVHRGSQRQLKRKTRMFQVIRVIGRWSMLDIFVIAILMGLVDIGGVATIEAGPAATFFVGVVVFTMLAANRFDTRLLWDTVNHE